MNNFFIILAAGNGARFKKKQKKQYTITKILNYLNTPLLKQSNQNYLKKLFL